MLSGKPKYMEKKVLNCPKCSTKMENLTFAGIDIDNCPFCNGCWLDNQEVSQMTRSRGQARLKVELNQPKPSDLNCPRCRPLQSLQVGPHVNIDTLILDQCPHCQGVWLDRGELTTLLSWRGPGG